MSLVDFSHLIQEKSQAYTRIIEFCHELLLTSSSYSANITRQYLISRYGSLDPFGITFGYFPDQEDLNFLIKEFGVDLLLELKLIYQIFSTNLFSGSLSEHNLIFPYLDEFGNIISLVGRQPYDLIKKEIGKYKTLKFQKSLFLFGLFQAKEYIWKQNQVNLVEGQFDCLSLWKSGIKNTVALGSINLSFYHFFSLLKYTNNFYLLFDQDYAGTRGVEKIIKSYKNFANWHKSLLPSDYKDIDTYLRTHSYSLNSYERLQTQSL